MNSGNTFSATLGLFGQVGIGISEPNSALKLGVTGKIGAQEYCDENGQNCSTPPFGAGGGGSCSNTPAQSTMTGNTVYTNNTSNKLIVVAFASAHDAQEDIEGWLKLSGGSWGLVTSDSSGTSATGARRDVAFVVPVGAQYKVVYQGGNMGGQSWELCGGGVETFHIYHNNFLGNSRMQEIYDRDSVTKYRASLIAKTGEQLCKQIDSSSVCVGSADLVNADGSFAPACTEYRDQYTEPEVSFAQDVIYCMAGAASGSTSSSSGGGVDYDTCRDVTGTAAVYTSTVSCNTDEVMFAGGGYCTHTGGASSFSSNHSFTNKSAPSGVRGWIVSCPDNNTAITAVAMGVCCKIK